jgi:hypothetical protein
MNGVEQAFDYSRTGGAGLQACIKEAGKIRASAPEVHLLVPAECPSAEVRNLRNLRFESPPLLI